MTGHAGQRIGTGWSACFNNEVSKDKGDGGGVLYNEKIYIYNNLNNGNNVFSGKHLA